MQGSLMKYWSKLFAVALIAVLVAAVVARAMRPPPIVAAYDRIQVGMTLEEVTFIMGKNPRHPDCGLWHCCFWEEAGYLVVVDYPPGPVTSSTRITSKEITKIRDL
jgi:hypothetical protein